METFNYRWHALFSVKPIPKCCGILPVYHISIHWMPNKKAVALSQLDWLMPEISRNIEFMTKYIRINNCFIKL